MICIKISSEAQNISSVEIKGHSGYAIYGKDIVCSAVSAITQTAVLGLIDVSTNEVSCTVNEEVGYMKFYVPTPKDELESLQQQTILKTMRLGLRNVIKGYSAFVKMEDE